MKEMIKNAMILIAITVIAGVILGTVYEVTKGTIADRELQDKKDAYREVFADAAEFKPYEDEIMPADERYTLDEEGYGAVDIDELNAAVDASGEVLGYVFTVTTSEGYGGDITLAVGIRKDMTVNGISILTINETAGLGMNAEKVLKPQFEGKQASHFTYTKQGASMPDEIDAISGATITTNAFVNAVNGCLQYYGDLL
ncbi:MAG: RnfABCDGE type electron transport complex subunit G [Lachnospiraceae bacterium]|nr:RnfABCDGE type electron transport complex subunit G [Lachnospiraceae bacterium]